MKNTTAFLFLLLICTLLPICTPVFAQVDSTIPPPKQRIQLGPFASINFSRNIADYHVSAPERTFGLGSNFGAMCDIPLDERFGVIAALGFYTLTFSDKNSNVDIPRPAGKLDFDYEIRKFKGVKLTTEGTFNYLSLMAMLRISYFMIGFNAGLPVGAKITNSAESESFPITYKDPVQTDIDVSITEDITPASSNRSFLFEVRFGGDFPVWNTDTGSLHFGLSGSYPLTTLMEWNKKDLPHLDDNFKMPSLQLHLSYLFNL
jgi:hypothetical protein